VRRGVARNVRAILVLKKLVTPRLAVLLLVLAAGTVSAQEQFYYLGNPEEDAPQGYQGDEPSDQAPQPDEYEGALQPYGTWQDAPAYGRFWRPSVAAGWQPYLDGQWVWTTHGWTWLSSEPWSWTFHYGRWSYLPTWGWAWFPGSVWGPAWVRWVWFGDFIGWAPLSSFGGPVFNQFVFVRGRDFCSPRLRRYVVRRDFVPRGVRTHWRDHLDRGPDRRWVERESGHPVRVVTDRPAHMLPPWQRRPAPRPESPTLSDGRDAAPRTPSSGQREPRRWNRKPGPPARNAGTERPASGGAVAEPPRHHPRGDQRLRMGGARPQDHQPGGDHRHERGPRLTEQARPSRWAPGFPVGRGAFEVPRGPGGAPSAPPSRGGLATGR
jgi:hypothetical protein